MSAEGRQVEHEKKVDLGDGRRAKRDTVVQKSMSKGSRQRGSLYGTRRILYVVLNYSTFSCYSFGFECAILQTITLSI